MNLKKTALITGVSRGIGSAICMRFLENGYHVHGTHYTTDIDFADQYSDQLTIHKVDFKSKNETLSFIESLKNVKIDVIVNNAGMFEPENFTNFAFQDCWYDTLQVNLTTPLLISVMLQNNINENGSIINIASTDGYIGAFSSMAYAASKAGLMNITKSLANNFGQRNIRVNAIAPGWIDTDMSTEESFDAVDITPLGRNGKPEEVADAVEYLASDKASFISGSIINVDGGYTCVDVIMKKEAEEFWSEGS